MESISKFFKVEKDFLYIRGMEEGIEKGESKKNIAFRKSLILGTGFDDDKIAKLVGISADLVKEVREALKK